MPQITLTAKQAQNIIDYCEQRDLEYFFIAKDEGAYLGAANGKDNILFFFRGCNPNKDPDYYETARAKFGLGDFGETFDLAILRDALAKGAKRLVFRVSATSISILSKR